MAQHNTDEYCVDFTEKEKYNQIKRSFIWLYFSFLFFKMLRDSKTFDNSLGITMK